MVVDERRVGVGSERGRAACKPGGGAVVDPARIRRGSGAHLTLGTGRDRAAFQNVVSRIKRVEPVHVCKLVDGKPPNGVVAKGQVRHRREGAKGPSDYLGDVALCQVQESECRQAAKRVWVHRRYHVLAHFDVGDSGKVSAG